MHPCIVGHVAQQFGDHYKSRPEPVRRLEHSETQLTYTSRSREQREFTIGLDVGAAYVNNIWLGFLLTFEIGDWRLISGGHTCTTTSLAPRVILLF